MPDISEKRQELITSENILKEFIQHYNQLTESEKFSLSSTFNQQTGGKLSPYNSPQPVAVALVPVYDPTSGDFWIIGGRRGIAPKIGEVALPGGFFEHHENGNNAAAREVHEELGLHLNPEKFIALPDQPIITSSTNNALSFMLYTEALPLTVEEVTEIMKGSATPEETQEVLFLSKGDTLAFSIHEEALNKFFNMKLGKIDSLINWADEYVPYTENNQKNSSFKMK